MTVPAPSPISRPALAWHWYLLLLVPPLLWSGNFVFSKALAADIPPLALAFWRWSLAGVILLAMAGPRAWQQRNALRTHWKLLLSYGVLAIAGYNTLVYVALQTSPALNLAVLHGSMPLVIGLLAWLWLREPLGWRTLVGMAVSFTGVAFLLGRGDPLSLLGLELQVGDAWGLLAILVWSVYSLMLRFKPQEIDHLVLLLVIVWIGVVILAPLYLWDTTTRPPFEPTWLTLSLIIYVGIAASILAHLAWNAGVVVVGAVHGGLYINLVPLFVAIMAIALLGESLFTYHLIGGGLIATGLMLSVWEGLRR